MNLTTDNIPEVGDTLHLTVDGEEYSVGVDSVNHVAPKTDEFEYQGRMQRSKIEGHLKFKGEDLDRGVYYSVRFQQEVGSDEFTDGELETEEKALFNERPTLVWESVGDIESVSVTEAGDE